MTASLLPEVTILFVDDDEEDLMLTRSHLARVRGTRYAVDWCPTLDQALPILRENKHDVCLLDYRLGDRNGLELFEQLGDIRQVPPIIMLTSMGTPEVDFEAMRRGATDFLEKQSVTAKELERAIRYAIQRRRVDRELLDAKEDLEHQNVTLMASYRKLEDISATWAGLIRKLSRLNESHVAPVQALLAELREKGPNVSKERVREVERKLHQTSEFLRPLTALSRTEKEIESKKVLLAETDRKQQILSRMALRGTGVEIDVAADEKTGRELLAKNDYDLVFVNRELIDLAGEAKKKNPQVIPIFLTSERASNYLNILKEYPFLCNIVSRSEDDRIFTLKNIIVTVSKLLGKDFFGMEKYLSWGVEVQSRPIVGSKERSGLIDEMEAYFRNFGIRSTIISKATMVAEELLSNAIYDAPRDASGRPLYNHLPRTVAVQLPPEQRGALRYTCDGTLLGVSVEDPFGALDRDTILQYLDSCYGGRPGTLQGTSKGGAGIGLFQIMEAAALLVINVRPHVKTEVIVLLHVDPDQRASNAATSFHYFFG
jgi:DNA-binding response OmpR family regulator